MIEPSEYARELYKRRSEVERQFRRLNGYRRIFSRFGKLNAMFQAFICLALIADGLRQGEQALVGTMLNRLLVVLKDSTKRRSILIQRKPLPQRLRPNDFIADRSPPTRSVGREKQMLGQAPESGGGPVRAGPGQHDAACNDRQHAHGDAPVEVLLEGEPGQQGRHHAFGIQQQGDVGGGHA